MNTCRSSAIQFHLKIKRSNFQKRYAVIPATYTLCLGVQHQNIAVHSVLVTRFAIHKITFIFFRTPIHHCLSSWRIMAFPGQVIESCHILHMEWASEHFPDAPAGHRYVFLSWTLYQSLQDTDPPRWYILSCRPVLPAGNGKGSRRYWHTCCNMWSLCQDGYSWITPVDTADSQLFLWTYYIVPKHIPETAHAISLLYCNDPGSWSPVIITRNVPFIPICAFLFISSKSNHGTAYGIRQCG